MPDGVPEQGRNVELRLAHHRLRIDHDPSVTVAQQIVMVEIAVDERRVVWPHRPVDLSCLADEIVIAGIVEPPRHEIADPPEWAPSRGRSPELPRRSDGDAHRLVFRAARGVVARTRALDEHRAACAIVPQQSHGAVTGQQGQRVGFVIGLVVLDRYDFQDRLIAGERDVREAACGDHLAQLDVPLCRDLVRRGGKPRAHAIVDSPGRSGEPRALAFGHFALRGPLSLARARTNRTSDSLFSQGRRSSLET